MKVFLTGATGYIGSAIGAALKRAGHLVTGLSRSAAADGKLRARVVTPVRGDLMNPASIERAARLADGVIHAAITNDAHAGEADANAVDAILRALSGSDKPFVYTGGVWVYGDTGGRVATEFSPLNPPQIVAWRVTGGRTVLDAAGQGVRAVVIHPAIVYGKGGGLPGMLAQAAREKGAAWYVGDGRNRWPVVHVDDLAELYVLALERALAGSIFIAANGEAVPFRDIARGASEQAGAGGKTVAWSLEEARKMLGLTADALAMDQQASSERAQRVLGWKPKARGILEDLRACTQPVTSHA
jgi:nucleoside-diphosphate-sugar epimerase